MNIGQVGLRLADRDEVSRGDEVVEVDVEDNVEDGVVV